MPQQNNNPNAHKQNQDGQPRNEPPKMAPDHDNRPKEAQDEKQRGKPGEKAAGNQKNNEER